MPYGHLASGLPTLFKIINIMFLHLADSGVQAISSRAERQVGDNVQGAGPTSKLEAGEKTFKAAQILLAVGLLFAFVGSAAVFIPASSGVLSDIRCACSHHV